MTDADRKQQVHKALVYAAGLCARSEQCTFDIRNKLQRRELPENEVEDIIDYLTKLRYLSDERYARSYVRTKSKLSGWGPWKIRSALAAKRISKSLIDNAMEETDAEKFEANALAAARRKCQNLNLNDRTDRMRLYRFLSSRGYGSRTVEHVMKILGAEQEDIDIENSWEE